MQINSPARWWSNQSLQSSGASLAGEEGTSVMRVRHGILLLSPSRSTVIRALFVVALSLLPSASIAQDEVKLNEAQARNIRVRVTRPVSSRTDQTLPYPARIVFPAEQRSGDQRNAYGQCAAGRIRGRGRGVAGPTA
jgi:hypothetical protein